MSCISLIGGGIGCGKTTFIDYIQKNEKHLFWNNECNDKEDSVENERKTKLQTRNICKIIFDELCSIEEQSQMMNTLKGWRNFRVDLLMAAEHFVNFLYNSMFVIFGPLTERSFHLLEQLKSINNSCILGNETIFFVEDNFYYRSMRYDWFQLARRANIGFCEIFLDCPLSISIDRNLSRGYNIPEEKILQMSTFMEYPEPDKYKWEKYSIKFNSSAKLENSSLKEVIDTIQEAAKYPAELIIMADKIEAQIACSKSIAHQADKILRKIISKKVYSYQGKFQGSDLKLLILEMTEIRQKLLHSIKQKSIDFSEDLLENLKKNGINSVKFEFEKALSDSFEKLWIEKLNVNNSFSEDDRCILIKSSEVL